MTASTDTEKTFNKIQHQFRIKNSQWAGDRRELPHSDQKLTPYSIMECAHIPLGQTQERSPLLPLPSVFVLEANRKGKKTK
jgi:hypothetical protein